MSVRTVAASLLGIALISPGGAAGAAGDLVVADISTGSDSSGAIVKVNPRTGKQTTISSNARSKKRGGASLFVDPIGVAFLPDGDLVVIDQFQGEGNGGTVIRVDPRTGKQRLISREGSLAEPMAITVSRSGAIYVADESALAGDDGDAAIFRINPRSGAQTVVSTNAKSKRAGGKGLFFDPLGLVVARNGNILVVDDESGNSSVDGDNVGGIVSVNPRNGKQTLLSSNSISKRHGGCACFNDPRGLTFAPNGDLYVTDDNMATGHPGQLSVIRVNLKTGEQTLISSNPRSAAHGGGKFFVRPYGIVVDRKGDIVVSDVNGPGPYTAGGVIRVDPLTGRQTLISSLARSRRAGGEEAVSDPIGIAVWPR